MKTIILTILIAIAIIALLILCFCIYQIINKKMKFNVNTVLKVIFAIILMLCCSISNAQIVQNGNTFKKEQTQNKKVETGYEWIDKDKTIYPILISKNDILYIERVSKKTGNTYRYYFDKETQEALKKIIFKDRQNKNNN